jgi:hypothetical protein
MILVLHWMRQLHRADRASQSVIGLTEEKRV